MGLRSCINTTHIPFTVPSHSISNVFVKSGKVKTSAEQNFSFKIAKVNFCSSAHLNTIDVLTTSFKGTACRTRHRGGLKN